MSEPFLPIFVGERIYYRPLDCQQDPYREGVLDRKEGMILHIRRTIGRRREMEIWPAWKIDIIVAQQESPT